MLLISVMTICIFFGYLFSDDFEQVTAADSKNRLLDLDHEMSITVCTNSILPAEFPVMNDNDSGELVYDLYRIAEAKDDNGELSFQFLTKYQDLCGAFEQNDWKAVAEKALIQTIGEEGSIVNAPDFADYTGIALNKEQTVTSGLYLLIARGSKKDTTVVTKVTSANSDMRDCVQTNGLATTTLIGIETYTVLPHLISVPGREVLEQTADKTVVGDWLYNQQIFLKMEEESATGSIEIEKTLLNYYENAENATFVFQVDTYFPTSDKLFQSEVYSIQFEQAGTKKIRLDGLPLGATVKIMEIYSGENYVADIVAPDSVNVIVSADSIPVAKFTNKHNGKITGGGGVTNHFTYHVTDGVGEWSWEKEIDNTTTVNGLTNKLVYMLKSIIRKEDY